MRILGLKVEDFKRVRLIEVSPGSIVEVTGRNKQGKSSLLDAVQAALGGKKHGQAKPIRRGADRARVSIDLGEIVVERIWTGKKERLVVTNKDGARYPAPQARLDKLLGAISFDPCAFMSLPAADQRNQMLRLAGVDLDGFESEHAAAFSERRDARRDFKTAQTVLESLATPAEGTPKHPIDLNVLADELADASDVNQRNRRARDRVALLATEAAAAQQRVSDCEQSIEALERRLTTEREKLATLTKDADGRRDIHAKAARSAKSLADRDIDDIQARMRKATQTNAEVAKAQALEDQQERVKHLREKVVDADDAVQAIANRKQAALMRAKVPVQGLRITEDGLLYRGFPLDQAAQSEQISVCTAICAALNPDLRVALVRQGNDLDDDTLAALFEACKGADLQCWVERRDGITEDSLVIEDGSLVDAEHGEEE